MLVLFALLVCSFVFFGSLVAVGGIVAVAARSLVKLLFFPLFLLVALIKVTVFFLLIPFALLAMGGFVAALLIPIMLFGWLAGALFTTSA